MTLFKPQSTTQRNLRKLSTDNRFILRSLGEGGQSTPQAHNL